MMDENKNIIFDYVPENLEEWDETHRENAVELLSSIKQGNRFKGVRYFTTREELKDYTNEQLQRVVYAFFPKIITTKFRTS